MTRYEQGFMNKCAEYGVDPQALARWARARGMQKRAAGEYAGAVPPEAIANSGTDGIPYYDPEVDEGGSDIVHARRVPNVKTYRTLVDGNEQLGKDPIVLAALETGAVDPKWWAAHTNAAVQATAPIMGLDDKQILPYHIRRAMAKNYHDLMLSQTSMPARVSSQAPQTPLHFPAKRGGKPLTGFGSGH